MFQVRSIAELDDLHYLDRVFRMRSDLYGTVLAQHLVAARIGPTVAVDDPERDMADV